VKSFLDRIEGDHSAAQHLPHSFIRCPETPGGANNFVRDAERIRELGGRACSVHPVSPSLRVFCHADDPYV